MDQNFEDIIRPFQDKLYRLSRRILQRDDEAEDVRQEVLLKLWKRRAELNTYRSVEAFAMTMARNLSLDVIRRRQKFSDHDESEPQSGSGADPHTMMVREDRKRMVHKAIDALPLKQRTIIQLRDIEEYSFEEISDLLEMDVNAVRVNLHRARKGIREIIWNYEQQERY
jgi:RNA polymerase sigma-70 factor (ECF subfamily)